jgi:hypothetical protein
VEKNLSWLVVGLEWPDAPGVAIAEAVLAVLPPVCPEYTGGAAAGNREVAGLLTVWGNAMAERPERVLFLSDLTDFLERQGSSWQSIDIDWQAGVEELTHRARTDAMPSVFLKVDRMAHLLLSHTPATTRILNTPRGQKVLDMSQREPVRKAIAGALQAYLERAAAAVSASR